MTDRIQDLTEEIREYSKQFDCTILYSLRDISGELWMNGKDCRDVFKEIEGREITQEEYDYIQPRSDESIREEVNDILNY